MLSKERKNEVISRFAESDNDTGSCQAQIGILTERISQISSHLKKFPKDKHSQHGLIKLVGKRRSFLKYMKKNDQENYERIVKLIKAQ
jgi:small subunit ribosomal protein S15